MRNRMKTTRKIESSVDWGKSERQPMKERRFMKERKMNNKKEFLAIYAKKYCNNNNRQLNKIEQKYFVFRSDSIV